MRRKDCTTLRNWGKPPVTGKPMDIFGKTIYDIIYFITSCTLLCYNHSKYVTHESFFVCQSNGKHQKWENMYGLVVCVYTEQSENRMLFVISN